MFWLSQTPAPATGFDAIPYVVNGGAMGLLAFILVWWLPQLVRAFMGLTKAIRQNTETIEIQGRAILVLASKVENPSANVQHQIESVSADFDRVKRRADEDTSNRG